jgi:endonuclease/exonuclease/phosphatase family metal-dependent hydrolase
MLYPTLKILSWNILASEWIEPLYFPTVRRDILYNRTKRFKRILKILKKNNPDIILLQEVMNLEHEYLIKHFYKKYDISFVNPIKWSYGKKSESGNVTLLRKNKIKDIVHTPLSFGIRTECSYNAAPLDILNIHLDDVSSKKRVSQVKTLKPLKKNCIVAGDFNQHYNYNNNKNKLYKIFNKFSIHNKRCPTYYNKKMNIDNILSRGFNIFESGECAVYPETIEAGLLHYGSDHLPVYTIIKDKR